MDKWIYDFDKRNPRKVVVRRPPPKIVKKLLSHRVLVVVDSNMFDKSAFQYLSFMKKNHFIDEVDIFYGVINNLTKLFKESYDKGYRIIISNNTTEDTLSTFEWVKTKKDLIVISSTSTTSSKMFVNSMPDKFIRTCVEDKIMLRFLLTDMLAHFYTYLNKSEHYKLAHKLVNTEESLFPFSKVVYIYESSLYTESYLTNLRDIIIFYEIPTELIAIKLEGGVLPEIAKSLLTYNNVSSSKYITSVDKPIIFLNSESPASLISYLDNPKYYDNYTIIGGGGDLNMSTPYKFTSSFLVNSNYDVIGHHLKQYVDSAEPIPFDMQASYKTINVCELFKKFINQKTKQVDIQLFYDTLMKYNFITAHKWAEQYLAVASLVGVLQPGTNRFTYNEDIIMIKHDFDDLDTLQLVQSLDTTVNYDFNELPENSLLLTFNKNALAFNPKALKFNKNADRIELLGSNMDTLLDTHVEHFFTIKDFTTYINWLNHHFKRDLEPYQFTQYFVYDAVLNFEIPEIYLDLIEITLPVNESDHTLYIKNLDELTEEHDISLTIPKVTYFTKSYCYDTKSEMILEFLTEGYSEETYDSFEIILHDSSPTLKIHLYRGHVFKIGEYDENTNIFKTTQIIRGFVNLPVHLNWLIIKTEYKIGDKVMVLATNSYGTVKSISSNQYEITVQMDSGVLVFTQSDIRPKLDLPE